MRDTVRQERQPVSFVAVLATKDVPPSKPNPKPGPRPRPSYARVQILGERLKAAREARGLSLHDVERQSRITHQRLANIEAGLTPTGRQRTTTRGKVLAIARAIAPPAGADIAFLERWLTMPSATLTSDHTTTAAYQAREWYRECADRAAALPLLARAARAWGGFGKPF